MMSAEKIYVSDIGVQRTLPNGRCVSRQKKSAGAAMLRG
jgi:hypothetical protein